MNTAGRASLLFLLNILDAVFTLYWVRNDLAPEGNHLMATLLDMGNIYFLAVKVATGAVTAFVLWHWRDFRLARFGLSLALLVYGGLMGIHFLTGLAAFGFLSDVIVHNFTDWTTNLPAFFH